MHYIILIYGDEKNFAMMADDPKAQEQMYAAFTSYGGDMQAAGVLRGGAELKPTHSATTVGSDEVFDAALRRAGAVRVGPGAHGLPLSASTRFAASPEPPRECWVCVEGEASAKPLS